jgi:AraC family transcriptional regulator
LEDVALVPSLEAYRQLKATMQLCSWDAGWRALLLRGYQDSPSAEEFTTAATPDHLFVLVVAGSCRIEQRRGKQWQAETYGVGSLGMTAPGKTATLRWESHEPHTTLQLHLPSSVLARQLAELWDRDSAMPELPHLLSTRDSLIQSTMIALRDGLTHGLPDLYAETSAEFLAAHLLLRHCHLKPLSSVGREDHRLRRVEHYMRDNLGEPISLAALSREAGLSRFHLLRLFKRAYGETPLKRLTRMRIEEARRRLLVRGPSIAEIALDCGYENAANFATAFRRVQGVTPSDYRRQQSRERFSQS